MPFKSQLPDVQPPEHFHELVSEFFWAQLDRFASRTLLVDYESGRTWTGEQIKSSSTLIAQNLIERCQMRPNDDCVFLYKHNDRIHLASLAVLFAGGSVCAGFEGDPEPEHSYMIGCMEAKFVFATRVLFHELLKIRKHSGLPFKIIIMDDDDDDNEQASHDIQTDIAKQQAAEFTFLFSRDLLRATKTTAKLPVRVHPDSAAFVLLTSGSTGRPKPVNRSYKNSLYVCFSLDNAQHLWDLNQSSVVAGHLPLDHGTGTFCFKMTLAKGLKLVVINGYQFPAILEAIERHQITDLVLGSAYVHNLITAPSELLGQYKLDSLSNLLAVGSKLASRAAARAFERRHPNCSIRQAFGMTECGFMTVQERARAHLDAESVGPLLPNLTIKLVERPPGEGAPDGQQQLVEIEQLGCQGELYVSGPTVSPGYTGGRQFRAQTAAAFLPDGFYKSNDICSLTDDHRLLIHGRYSEVLCLLDGWKVLPFEIEQVLLQHPRVKEAAVVGVPHPDLATCHAPRAYVVLKDDDQGAQEANGSNGCAAGSGSDARQPTGDDLFEFSKRLLAEPKHLTGGIKIMQQLPRISVGKVDKKLLKRLDGYA